MLLNTSGQISLLRVHDVGTRYGPPSDSIDVEVVVQFVGRPADAFGFQLRSDSNNPARRGMLDLLRDVPAIDYPRLGDQAGASASTAGVFAVGMRASAKRETVLYES